MDKLKEGQKVLVPYGVDLKVGKVIYTVGRKYCVSFVIFDEYWKKWQGIYSPQDVIPIPPKATKDQIQALKSICK